MGTGDSQLTAQWDAIYYRIVFDGTPNIGNPTLTTNAGKAGNQQLYLEQDVTAFNNKMASLGDSTGATDQSQIKYTLRYDKTYTLPKNDVFRKLGYTLVGWQTRMPQTEAEMETMASGSGGYSIVTSFDGTGKDIQQEFNNNFYKESDGNGGYIIKTVKDSQNKNNNVQATGYSIIKDGGQVKNLTYGDYAANEIITKQYKTVTLYAIWKLNNYSSNVYYSLQKADGTYSYSTTDTTNVQQANQSYIEIDDVTKFQPTTSYTWLTSGGAWNNRTIKSKSRVYKYGGSASHSSTYVQIDIENQILPDQTKLGRQSYYDTGKGIVLQTDGKNIFIQIPRKKVHTTVYGLIQTNGSSKSYVKPSLTTDDNDIVGTFSVTASNSSGQSLKTGVSGTNYIETTSQTTVDGLYGLTLTSYYGAQLKISNIKAKSSTTLYAYKYKGYTAGQGQYSLTETQAQPQSTGTSLTLTPKSDCYVLMFFDRSYANVQSSQVVWGEMTRQYNDPYSIGVNGQAYSGVQSAVGPWQNIMWKSFKVGSGQTTNKIYYMQLWLDNSVSGADQRDRLNLNASRAPQSDAYIELRRYVANKDIIIVRFPTGITEANLQTWIRNNLAVVQYTDPYANIQDRLHIFLTSIPGYYGNNTGQPTGQLSWQAWAGLLNGTTNTGFQAQGSDTQSKAYLIYDGQNIYWKYRNQYTQTKKSGPEGNIQAGDRIPHSYSHNKFEYAHSAYTINLPQGITQIPGFQWARAIKAGATAMQFVTEDNGVHVDVDGKAFVGGQQAHDTMLFINGSESFGGVWSWTSGNKTSVGFDLYGGDCSRANTSAAWGEDHGGQMKDLWVEWEYSVLVDKTSYIGIQGGVATKEYTIPTQYPVIIKYDGSTQFNSLTTTQTGSSIQTQKTAWSNVPATVTKGFDYRWIYGSFANGNSYSATVTQGKPTSYSLQLSKNILSRYGYVWDGRWYVIYNPNNVQTDFNWLTNRIGQSKGTSNYNSSYLKTSLLQYNDTFGSITNSSQSRPYRFTNYGYGQQEIPAGKTYSAADVQSNFTPTGYMQFTTTGAQSGSAMTLDYNQMLLLWLQSGAQYSTSSINDSYTGNAQKQVKCRVITLYAARTVPIQYTVRFASGGTDQFEGTSIPYSWSVGNYTTAGSINNNAQATTAYQALAQKHALQAGAYGNDQTYGAWYRQQFTYDQTKTLQAQQFQRPNNGLTIDGEKLSGYQFIGWTTYKDTYGNNEQAQYRSGSTKIANKGVTSTTQTSDTTKAVTSQQFTSGQNGQIAQSSGQTYNIGEANPYFLANSASVNNLLNTVQFNTTGTPYTVNGQIQAPKVVYQDDFKWPEIVVYPNWKKTVTLTVKLDANCTDTSSQGKINGINGTQISSQTAYGQDIIYNNQLYYPVSLDRIVYNTLVKNGQSVQGFQSWRGSYSNNGVNSLWTKKVASAIKDRYLTQISTEYRFLGLQFSDKTTYPTSAGTQATNPAYNGTGTVKGSLGAKRASLTLPAGAPISSKVNERAYSSTQTLTHPRVYALQTFDTNQLKSDFDSYSSILQKLHTEPTTQTRKSGYVGTDNTQVYFSTIDCYNNTTLYAVWEPVLQTQLDVTRVGSTKLQLGDQSDNRVKANKDQSLKAQSNKAGQGFTIMTALDGIIPTSKGDSKTLWSQTSYQTVLEYRYNTAFTSEIINLYKDPIASDKKYSQVLDKLNNQATFTSNQRDGKTQQTPKIQTAHSYQSWQFFLPLYLGTNEMANASGGKFIYDANKAYSVELVASRYSFYYANYVSDTDSRKDQSYKDNETVKATLNIFLSQNNSVSGGGGTTNPDNPSGTPNPPGTSDSAGSILDDLKIHVQLH